ncbi:MAG: hypoxanthine phosphoribosyltransferase [Desulfococcaceae bacterium]|jgi:hypoxanthine phosphoribosyltransferase|nr:hypoxanthine phosphoribosyltransferase [Desulfococcaceae bacterium]
MSELIPVVGKKEIEDVIRDLAAKISEDYKNADLVLMGVLKGAFIFLSDLSRHLSIPVQIDFIQTSSYGAGTSSSGKIRLVKKPDINIRDKDVLLVEDIVDTGLTLQFLMDYLNSFHPRSVKVCAFLDKKERRENDVAVDYACKTVEKGFLVGYGLDYAENYRSLPGIYHLKL